MPTRLTILGTSTENLPVLPAKSLGGSAPCLESIYLRSIPFPSLPPLLVSASNLVFLTVEILPRTGYVSPEATVVDTLRPASDMPPAARTVLP